jgi:long-chain acyl-CoA synthetase
MSAARAVRPWAGSYGAGVPAGIDRDDRTLTDMLRDTVAAHPTADALVYFRRRLTYRQLDREVDAVARGLVGLGVRAGDRVALLLPNSPQHVIAFYAILRLGAIVVEHNPLYTLDELAPQFRDHEAKVVIAWDRVAGSLLTLAAAPLRTVVSVSLRRALPLRLRAALRLPLKSVREVRDSLPDLHVSGALPWETLRRSRGVLPEYRGTADDAAVIQYTSGTSGTPKGTVLTHRSLMANARQGRAWLPGVREAGETVYAVLPMFHAYGLTLCLTFSMSIAAKLVLFPAFEPRLVLQAMRTDPATFLPAVPPVYERLLRAAATADVSLAGIRYAISGAMPLSEKTVADWERATGGGLVEGYGMTEASPIIAGNPIGGARRTGSVGVPFPGTDVRVRAADNPTGPDLPVGQIGELQVRGPQVCRGYWNRPDETRATILPGGWLRTGDLVRMDADGFITIVDRLKELIISGGFNVLPAEVERALRAFPDVVDVAVVGVPRRHGGEQVAAALVMRAGSVLDRARLAEFCRERLAEYKIPRRFAEVAELPKSMVGKVMRRLVREQVFG